ncbi:murein hydrolase activator EnvC family protein [Glaciimonas soli]|uniref:Peptidoglycan DD-metalloendopeptidase family protein n=1 Tax=Glaciimonas soli TaxID=2590999 RepID=A0A843YMY5_9BURK|nr:peptidoglycan DD-metalloendopeptidase family protein [Glaciimonas soli]MQR00300.1 peptidoglycan DD-metalloendopeptidase family protein [Glaciimonas soli]
MKRLHLKHRALSSPASAGGVTGAWRAPVLTLLLALIFTAAPGVHAAAKITERSKQKQAAENARADLSQKLQALKRDINQTETEKDSAEDALADSEAAISDANRSLRDLSDEQKQTQTKLAQLSKKHDELSQTVKAQQTQMATLLRQQYVAGNEDRIKLLLSGDNPNRINRELQYMGYVSQAQAKLIEALRASIQAVEANQTDMRNAQDDLDEIAQDQRDQKSKLETEKNKHATLLTQLSSKLVAQRKEVGKTERDDQRLAGLVDKLGQLIEDQKKIDAANREKQRQAQLAKAQAAQAARAAQAAARAEQAARALEKQRQRATNAAKSTPTVNNPQPPSTFHPDPIDDDQPPPALAQTPAPAASTVAPEPASVTAAAPLERNEITPEASPDVAYGRSFASLKGQLRLPVKGELMNRFGSSRGDGPPSKGLFIRAPEGAEVKSIAAGRVVFADWLRGFGNLIIIDHGNQYLTIYGNNQSLLKRPGDVVKPGDVIASAGNSGGNEQSGLYFEIRHQGRAFDPIGWVTTR